MLLKIRRYAILLVVTLIVVGAFSPLMVQAQSFPGAIVPPACAGPDAATKCNLCQLTQLARNLLNFAIFLAIVISAVLFAWAGMRYMTAQGDPGTIKVARQTLLNVFLGLLLILCAWLVINTLMGFMVKTDFKGLLPWNSLCDPIRTGDGYTSVPTVPLAAIAHLKMRP
ncbi:hypothetical protein C4568_02125 [Candidatus Parcubacteria bacterium]|nr:MAG: hypothetical protein C4568_02125 [Candidatus Parcubacteria bacterium]